MNYTFSYNCKLQIGIAAAIYAAIENLMCFALCCVAGTTVAYFSLSLSSRHTISVPKSFRFSFNVRMSRLNLCPFFCAIFFLVSDLFCLSNSNLYGEKKRPYENDACWNILNDVKTHRRDISEPLDLLSDVIDDSSEKHRSLNESISMSCEHGSSCASNWLHQLYLKLSKVAWLMHSLKLQSISLKMCNFF